MKGYKAFNKDWTCRGFQYEVGETFKYDEELEMCYSGFHFCTNLADCFTYYSFDKEKTVIAEVEAIGQVIENESNSKCCTDEIKILKELSWSDVLKGCNVGGWNTGNRNTGNRNEGNWNTGSKNKGHCNAGDWNVTDYSNGCFNTVEAKIYLFNRLSSWTINDWLKSGARHILNLMPGSHGRQDWRDSLLDDSKKEVLNLPNFDKAIFKQITGIEVEK